MQDNAVANASVQAVGGYIDLFLTNRFINCSTLSWGGIVYFVWLGYCSAACTTTQPCHLPKTRDLDNAKNSTFLFILRLLQALAINIVLNDRHG
jgi:hypothetical protein